MGSCPHTCSPHSPPCISHSDQGQPFRVTSHPREPPRKPAELGYPDRGHVAKDSQRCQGVTRGTRKEGGCFSTRRPTSWDVLGCAWLLRRTTARGFGLTGVSRPVALDGVLSGLGRGHDEGKKGQCM